MVRVIPKGKIEIILLIFEIKMNIPINRKALAHLPGLTSIKFKVFVNKAIIRTFSRKSEIFLEMPMDIIPEIRTPIKALIIPVVGCP